MSQSVILSLAVLKANWDVHRRDYIDSFLPFVTECVRTSPNDAVSLSDVQSRLHAVFHLELPQNVIQTILRRMYRSGLLVRDRGIYLRNKARLSESNFDAVRRDAADRYEALIDDLVAFCHDEHQVSWSKEQAENALADYINEDKLQLTCEGYTTHIRGRAAGATATTRYLVGSYIQSLFGSGSPHTDAFEMITQGNLLANAVFLPDPNRAQSRFRRTMVFLDGPFLLFALGYAGKERRDPCIELLALLRQNGATLRCFRHTLEEMRDALDACAYQIEKGDVRFAYGPSIEYFLSLGKSASDIRLYSARLGADLAEQHIDVVDAPPYYEHSYVIDEAGLAEALRSAINYRNPRALERDTASVAAIMRLRRGQIPFLVEECHAVLVTMNVGLVRASSKFIAVDECQNGVAACITDYSLANLLWLKEPTKAPDLPRKRIIADFYAATQPDAILWHRYLAEIARLEQEGSVSANDYYVLRHSFQARSALMDVTKGDEVAFTQGTVQEILDQVRSAMLAELEETHAAELEQHEREREASISRLEAEKQSEQAARILAESLADEAHENEQRRRQRVASDAHRDAHRLRILLHWAGVLVLALAFAYAFPWTFPPLLSAWPRYLLGAVTLTANGFGFVSAVWGGSLAEHCAKIEPVLAMRIERWYLKRAAFD